VDVPPGARLTGPAQVKLARAIVKRRWRKIVNIAKAASASSQVKLVKTEINIRHKAKDI
jgi:hypothetical protein